MTRRARAFKLPLLTFGDLFLVRNETAKILPLQRLLTCNTREIILYIHAQNRNMQSKEFKLIHGIIIITNLIITTVI